MTAPGSKSTDEPGPAKGKSSSAPLHDSRSTIKDVAALLGIAASTVSRALSDHPHVSDATKAKVRSAVADLDYVPHLGARLMRNGHANLIGYIIPDLEHEGFVTAARLLSDACVSAGYQLLLLVSNDDPQRELAHVEALIETRAAAIVIAACHNSLPRTKALLHQITAVQSSSRNPSLGIPISGANEAKGLYLATRHLVQFGHRRIVFVGGEGLNTGDQRLAGYRAALSEAGTAHDPALEFRGAVKASYSHTVTSKVLAMSPRPTALVVAASPLTLGIVEVLSDAGVSVPGDLSIVGFGDPPWFRLWNGGLTTVRPPTSIATQTALSMVLERIGEGVVSDDNPPVLLFDPELVVRASTGAAPAA